MKRLSNLLRPSRKGRLEGDLDNHYSANSPGVAKPHKKSKFRRTLATAVLSAGMTILASCHPYIPSPISNKPPAITEYSLPSSGYEGTKFSGKLVASDSDGDNLSASLSQTWATLGKPAKSGDTTTWTISGTLPSVSSNTNYDVTAKVSDSQYNTSETVSIADNSLGVNFTSVENNYLKNLNEAQTFSNVQLPQKDNVGNIVTYSSVTSLNPSIASVTYSGGSTFNLTGQTMSQDNSYTVQVSFSDSGISNGQTQTIDLSGEAYNLDTLDIHTQDNETHTAQTGIDEFFFTDSSGTHSVNSSNSTLLAGSWGVTDANGNQIIDTGTDSSGNPGYVSVRINERGDNISGLELAAGIGSYTTTPPAGSGFSSSYFGPTGSFVRVLSTNEPNGSSGGTISTMSLGDNTLTVYPTPLTTLLNTSGIITTSAAYRTFVHAAEGGSYIYPKFFEYNGKTIAAEIAGTNPNDGSTYTNDSNALTEISAVVTEISNLIPGGIQQYQTSGTPNYSGPGYGVIVPANQTSLNSICGSGAAGCTTSGWSYILNTLTGSTTPTIQEVTIHEGFHLFVEPMDLGSPYNSKDSVAYESYTSSSPAFTNADKKLTHDVFQKTYKKDENIDNFVLAEGYATVP